MVLMSEGIAVNILDFTHAAYRMHKSKCRHLLFFVAGKSFLKVWPQSSVGGERPDQFVQLNDSCKRLGLGAHMRTASSGSACWRARSCCLQELMMF